MHWPAHWAEGWELGLYTHLYTHYVVPGIHPVYHLYTLPKKEIIHLYTPVYHLYNLLYTWHHVVSPVYLYTSPLEGSKTLSD